MKKNKNVELVDVKEFFQQNQKSKKKFLKWIVIGILLSVFLLSIGIIYVRKDNCYERLKLESFKYEKILKEKDKIIKLQNEKLEYFTFKEFFTSIKHENMDKILKLVWKYAKINEIDPYFVLLIIDVESGFNYRARSNMGAYGLMQVHFVSWKYRYNLKNPEELYDIDKNIRLGCEIFKYYIDKTEGDLVKALLMYNSGNLKFRNLDYVSNIQRSKFFTGF